MSADSRYYLDTSALLPYYREENASRKIQQLLLSLEPPIFISDLTKVEFASAIARWVRMEELSEAQADLVETTFAEDIDSGLYVQRPLMPRHFRQAEKWLNGRKTALRTLDALHLACCWSMEAKIITCDNILKQAAEALGVGLLPFDVSDCQGNTAGK